MNKKIKAEKMLEEFLGRSSIEGAYALVDESDSWYDTINTVHKSLKKLKDFKSLPLEILSKDGLKLKGIYYPCEGSNKTVIFVHGYKSHAERESAFPGLFYMSLGYNLLVPYQRAHGESEGQFITFGAKECSDLSLWADKINQINGKGSIVIHGFSMGAEIALLCCDKHIKNLKAIIADAPCVSTIEVLKTVAKERFGNESEEICAYAVEIFKERFGVDPHLLDGNITVKQSKYPILFTAGSTEQMEEELINLSKICPTPSSVVILQGCEHGNGMYKQTQIYQNAIIKLLSD